MNKQQQALRTFFDWAKMGMCIPDLELILPKIQDSKISATAKSEVGDAFDELLIALVHVTRTNQQALTKELSPQNVIDFREWKKKRH